MSTTPSSSPPRTPDDRRMTHASQVSTPSSDDSDVSFNYIVDDQGNLVRLSKGSGRSDHSSPPTPQDSDFLESPVTSHKVPSTSHMSPMARSALSRSESAHSVLVHTAEDLSPLPKTERNPRSFQKVASGPTPSLGNPLPSYLAPTASSLSKPRSAMRRVTAENERERSKSSSISWSRPSYDSNALQEEKENISEPDEYAYGASVPAKHRASPPLVTRSTSSASVSRATGGARASYLTGGSVGAGGRPPAESQRGPRRVVKTSIPKYSQPSSAHSDRAPDTDASEGEGFAPGSPDGQDTEAEDDPLRAAPHPLRQRSQGHSSRLAQSTLTRPRRSASFSDAAQHDDYQLQVAQQYQASSSRPGTSMSGHTASTNGARRAAQQEWDGHEFDEYGKYRPQFDDLEGYDHEPDGPTRQSPSPTRQPQSSSTRSTQGHKRRDSDTLRNGPSYLPTVDPHSISPPPSKVVLRRSPSTNLSRGRHSPPQTRTIGRSSPPVKGRTSPPATATKTVRDAPKQRRSPNGPEAAPSRAREPSGQSSGKQFSAGSKNERERKEELERGKEREPEREKALQNYNQVPADYPAAPDPPLPGGSTVPAPLNRHIVVNKKAYARLDMIGKGGSSRVFRVLSHTNELYAIKRVSLDKTDAETMNSYMNEIALLKRLEGNSRIIRLIDSEVKPGPQGSKGYLMLVMECGEVDFARLLQEQMREPLNMVWVGYYWQQMLQAVQVIHEEKIVHSDLKPANFVLVKGQLKLIDFGIANAIANDTTNIQRDHQIGTVNYMSPEAIELPDGMRRLKVGRASDVWSLGCILYQMVYGHPPFQHLSVYQKMKAIPDMTHVIEFAEYATPTTTSRSSSLPGGPVEPPKKLDHLKVRVRKDVISSMKSCLCRTPKERATIPELMEHGWLSGREEAPATPDPNVKVADLLGPNESVIDVYYMAQLLAYGIQYGLDQASGKKQALDQPSLQEEAKHLILELQLVQASKPEEPQKAS